MNSIEAAKRCFSDTVKLFIPNTPEYRLLFSVPLEFYLRKTPQEAAMEICFMRWECHQSQKIDKQTLREIFLAMDDCDKYGSIVKDWKEAGHDK